MNEETLTDNDKYLSSDKNFNELYPRNIQILSKRHWTPVHIARLAADFLASDGKKILDIGSGVGKFCLTGGCYHPNTQFYGVEQREYLIKDAIRAQQTLDIKNVSFIHGNFSQLNLQEFDHFYFYNPFYENIDGFDRIDEDIDYSDGLYEYYVRYLHKGLQQLPKGTKIVTFHSLLQEIPKSYELVESHQNNELIFWVKK